MTIISLQTAMNRVAAQLAVPDCDGPKSADFSQDAVLDALRKHYEDACACYARLVRLLGAGDPMVETAAAQMANCRGALEHYTRGRRCAATTGAVAANVEELETDRTTKARSDGERSFIECMMLWLMLRQSCDNACRQLRIARTFMRVSGGVEPVARYAA